MEKLQTFDSLVSKNDFVIKFANVNGSGSASANQMFAKAVFRTVSYTHLRAHETDS